MTSCDIFKICGISKVKIGKDVRCLMFIFANVVCTIFPLKLFCMHIVKNVYDLKIMCAKISTSSIYTGANEYLLISRFPPWSSPTLRTKYRVSKL